MLILALNVGSSSVRSALFDASTSAERLVFAAAVTKQNDRLLGVVSPGDGRPCEEVVPGVGVDSAIGWLLERVERKGLGEPLAAVGHRLVHGGLRYREPVWLTRDVMDDLQKLIPLAPDHLPVELAAVRQVSERWPHTRASASFDTAFHASLPDRARLFGIPRCFSDGGVVRFGFHGLSYEYVVGELRRIGALEPRVVVAHLGSGASLAAIRDGESIDTTMGFTPTGGIIMATRSGDLDPGVLLYLARTHDLDSAALSRVVNVDGGLLGLSATTGDMRTLLARSSEDPRAAAAVDIFCYQVGKAIASLAVALGGLDSLVFTGGIGEHAAPVRRQVCESLAWCAVTLDDSRNDAGRAIISSPGAPVTVQIVPTNEELMIVRHTLRLLNQGGDHDDR
jgi:acetate kinase